MNHTLVCIVGMCGAGKSIVSQHLMERHPFHLVRFGQIVLDRIDEMGEVPSEPLERQIREELRQEHGMAAFAVLNMPKFDALLETGDVIGDNLISWEEYVALKEKYADRFVVIAVYAPPAARYSRLANRAGRHVGEDSLRFRSIGPEDAAKRDAAELEALHKGGPIAMADYTVINTGSVHDLERQIDHIVSRLFPDYEGA